MILLLRVIILLFSLQIMRLFGLAANVKIYRDFWKKKAEEESPADHLLYIALGDSAAQGIGASNPRNGYVGLLAESLRKKHRKPVKIVNLSVTGATVKTALKHQMPKLADYKITDDTVITLDIGGNDVVKNTDPDDFGKYIDELFSRLPKRCIVGDIPSFSRTRMPGREKLVNQFNEIIYERARKYNLKIAPLNKTTSHDKSWLTASADLFHPSNRGYRNWHKAYWSILNK